jgi:dTDP-4-amino-4,6-dideoxygalactose transaminase
MPGSPPPYPTWRSEIALLKERGWAFNDPSEVVELFEEKLAKWTGAPYAVATDSATHAMELALRFTGPWPELTVPKHTYVSVPQLVRKLGAKVKWNGDGWEGIYKLAPSPVVDASLRLRSEMYIPGTFMCLSFQIKKRLPIGRGGMILTDDAKAYEWLKRAVYDGRTPGKAWRQDVIQQMGYHYYMTPEDAARGLLLFDNGFESTDDLWRYKEYPDLTVMDYFQRINEWT